MLTTGLIGNGSVQGDALPVVNKFNVFGTVASGTGAILPQAPGVDAVIFIANRGANTLKVYPPLAGKINGGTTDASVNLAAAATARYKSDRAGNYWTF